MSYSSMTLKNVMGGCVLIDYKRSTPDEKSLSVDLSLIGVNLHELQKNLIPNIVMSHNYRNNTEVRSDNCTAVIGSDFISEVQSQNNNSVCNGKDNDNNVIKNDAESETTIVHQSNLELFDFNANKIVKAESTDLRQPVFTSIQNFYETFDVSDQIESIADMENSADSPSSTSTFDSSCEQDHLTIYGTANNSIPYQLNFEIASTEDQQYELHIISNAEDPKVLTPPLSPQKILNREVQSVDPPLYKRLESKENKKKSTVRASRKKPSVEKNISCSRCSKKFRTAAHLKVHFVVHKDNECVHRCTICERRFCHRGALALHARKHAFKHSNLISS